MPVSPTSVVSHPLWAGASMGPYQSNKKSNVIKWYNEIYKYYVQVQVGLIIH